MRPAQHDEPSVCVVIPVYQAILSAHERIALTQCVRVLGRYPIVFVCPASLDVTPLVAEYAIARVHYFADAFFVDIGAYNRLMLSDSFYQAFASYEYVLIHQLDAFVFRDELAYWCRQNYDYVGAPWLRDKDFDGWADEAWFDVKQRIATWLSLKKADGLTPREIQSQNRTGNGGLSLRRVAALRGVLARHKKQLGHYFARPMHQYNEDVFFSVEVNRFWPWLRIPPFRIALRFAVEFYPERAVDDYNGGRLPFGCHAWAVHGTAYWRPVFARLGYQI